MEKQQPSFRFRLPRSCVKLVVTIVALGMSFFHIYTAVFGTLEPLKQRSLHVALALTLAFLIYPISRGKKEYITLFDLLLAFLPLGIAAYFLINYDRVINRIEFVSPMTTWDIALSVLLIALILEAARRVTGNAMVMVALAACLYAFAGPYLPGGFWHRGLSLSRFIDQMTMTLGGIYSTPIAVSATYVFLFILFGSFLVKTGTGQAIIDLAHVLTGHSKGGPAKAAIASSALFGSINGSSVANVITTGTFTIPMMKSLGYQPAFAAAVEAVASTGGQIMPPIMGAAAFVMAELMGISYILIVKAAILPAVLYYIALYVMVHLEAERLGLGTSPRAEFREFLEVLSRTSHLFVPVAGLLYMLIKGYSPSRAGIVAIASLIVVSSFKRESRLSIRGFLEALEDGARGSIVVAVTCATAGIVIGVVTALGVGFKVTSAIVGVSGGNMFLALIMVMCATLLLGMGLPTTAAYIIAASVSVPPLIQMGVPRLAANFFAFYFACVSSITPPVAVASYAAAALADADPTRTGWIATKLGIGAFLVPFMFVFGPELLLEGHPARILLAVITAIVGISAIAMSVQGWYIKRLGWLTRVVMFAGGLMMVKPGSKTDMVGLALIIIPFVAHVIACKTKEGVEIPH
ncbi:MAG: TRAP transporter permease [Limnochordia bacterium]|jgi:TRAP transporter 4TM/12TM fusion protein